MSREDTVYTRMDAGAAECPASEAIAEALEIQSAQLRDIVETMVRYESSVQEMREELRWVIVKNTDDRELRFHTNEFLQMVYDRLNPAKIRRNAVEFIRDVLVIVTFVGVIASTIAQFVK